MRRAYHEDLQRLVEQLQLISELLGRDLRLAEQVISGDEDVERTCADFDKSACTVLALQAPVAGELRSVIAMLQVADNVRRMAGLARHIAEAARRRYPESAVPPTGWAFR
jgi:phosphate transport system protein